MSLAKKVQDQPYTHITYMHTHTHTQDDSAKRAADKAAELKKKDALLQEENAKLQKLLPAPPAPPKAAPKAAAPAEKKEAAKPAPAKKDAKKDAEPAAAPAPAK
jgi:hypothetical protein